MTKLLREHMKRLQSKAAEYIEPDVYHSLDKHETTANAKEDAANPARRDILFVNDIIYLLDGPEQRAAEADASFDFVAESMVTASNTFHGDKVSVTEVIGALQTFSAAAERLDRIKKALFYGRDYIPNSSRPSPSRPDEDNAAYPIIERVADQLIAAGNPPATGDCSCGRGGEWGHDGGCPETQNENDIRKNVELAFHAIVGVATEAGEMVDAWLNAYMHGKQLDMVNLREEFGDNQWYVAVFLSACSKLTFEHEPTGFDELHRLVNRKLRGRFPDGFNEFDANNRDLVKERRILEGQPVYDPRGDDYTFSTEEVAAGSEMRGQPVEPPFGCKPLEFPDEPTSGVDPAPGKLSDEI